jgi:hypothetical protein
MSNSSSSMSIDFGGTFTFTMSPHYKIINLLNSKENNSNKGFNMTDLAIVGVRQTLRSMVDCKLHGHPLPITWMQITLQITWTSIANYLDIHCKLQITWTSIANYLDNYMDIHANCNYLDIHCKLHGHPLPITWTSMPITWTSIIVSS